MELVPFSEAVGPLVGASFVQPQTVKKVAVPFFRIYFFRHITIFIS